MLNKQAYRTMPSIGCRQVHTYIIYAILLSLSWVVLRSSLWVALTFPRRNLVGALFRCEDVWNYLTTRDYYLTPKAPDGKWDQYCLQLIMLMAILTRVSQKIPSRHRSHLAKHLFDRMTHTSNLVKGTHIDYRRTMTRCTWIPRTYQRAISGIGDVRSTCRSLF